MRSIKRISLLSTGLAMAAVGWLSAREPVAPGPPASSLTASSPTVPRPRAIKAADVPAKGQRCETLVIHERDEALLALVAPVAAKLSNNTNTVLLAVMRKGGSDELQRLLANTGSTRAVWLQTQADASPREKWSGQPPQSIVLPADSLAAGVELARRFWRNPEEVVLVPEGDGEAGLLGSTLAAHRRVPFLRVGEAEDGQRLAKALQTLGAKRVTVVACRQAEEPVWQGRIGLPVTTLGSGQAQHALVALIGPQRMRNVIVVRAPEGPAEWARSNWLAPYLSFVRGSAVLVPATGDAAAMETEMEAFVKVHKLRPRTVTLLADYQNIGIRTPGADLQLREYVVEIEPCSGPGPGGAAAYGVGRIPFSDAATASAMIARGLARDRALGGADAGVLMVANPRTEYGSLPLAETVARFQVEELRNRRVPVQTFYGTLSHQQEIRQAARSAGLVIYQGHITDQTIFPGAGTVPQAVPADVVSPEAAPQCETTPLANVGWRLYDWAWVQVDRAQTLRERLGQEPHHGSMRSETGDGDFNPGPVTKGPDAPSPPPSGAADSWDAGGSVPADESQTADQTSPADPQPPCPADPAGQDDPSQRVQLDRSALVILQSCSSLHNDGTLAAVRAGACGVIGSTTSIHSASGSSFVKAWGDAALRGGETVGEAMRDARNYFLLLARLKEARGHKQQAKTLRVGLSFRLWGDPEVTLFPPAQEKPVCRPIAATLRRQTVTLQTPRRKLPEAKTEKYAVRAYPGSQTAGIVKRIKGKPYRRLMPVYFLRLDLPAGSDVSTKRGLVRSGDKDTRAVFSVDPLGRYVYVLYFPEQETRGEKITLTFQP